MTFVQWVVGIALMTHFGSRHFSCGILVALKGRSPAYFVASFTLSAASLAVSFTLSAALSIAWPAFSAALSTSFPIFSAGPSFFSQATKVNPNSTALTARQIFLKLIISRLLFWFYFLLMFTRVVWSTQS